MPFKIYGNIKPKVGTPVTYSLDAANTTANTKWSIWILENGKWYKTNGNNKVGATATYKFVQRSLTRKGIQVVAHHADGTYGFLNVKPQKASQPKIDKVELLDGAGKKVTGALHYSDTLFVKIYCTGLFGETLYVTLWEDDAIGAGHNKINEKNKINNLPLKVKVNARGMAYAKFALPKYYFASIIANAQVASGSVNEGKTHEYYVTVEYYGKQKASNNVNVVNPDHKETTPAKPAPTPKKTPAVTPVPVKPKPQEPPVVPTPPATTPPQTKPKVPPVIVKKEPVTVAPTTPPAKPPKSTNPQKVEGDDKPAPFTCECLEIGLIWGKKVDCKFRKKVVQICKDLWPTTYEDAANSLMAIIAFETARTFDPSKQNAYGFTGLIQFGKDAAADLGTTTDKLKAMNAVTQLDYVKAYFSLSKFKGKVSNLTEMYLAVNYPAMVINNKTKPDDVLYAAPNPAYYRNPALMYEKGERANRPEGKKVPKYGFNNGKTYVWEVTSAMKEFVSEGLLHKFDKKPTSAPSNTTSDAVVVTDAGHGIDGDGGAKGNKNPDTESIMALTVETETSAALTSFGIKAKRTRTINPMPLPAGNKEDISYRVKFFKDNGGQVMISHHLNDQNSPDTFLLMYHPDALKKASGPVAGGSSAGFLKNSLALANYIKTELEKIGRKAVLRPATYPNINFSSLGVLRNVDSAKNAALLIEMGSVKKANTDYLKANAKIVGKAIAEGTANYLGVKKTKDAPVSIECEEAPPVKKVTPTPKTTPEKEGIVTYHIYQNGTIEKHIPTKIKAGYEKKYKYVYYDKAGTENEICISNFVFAKKWIKGSKNNGGKGWVSVGGRYYQEGQGTNELLKMPLPLNYSKNGVIIKLADNTTREYINPTAFASIIGALGECNYSDVAMNGFTSQDGTGAPSVSHVNGIAGDFRYLRKDKSGANLLINNEPSALDIVRQEKFIDALIKFGYASFLSFKIVVNGKNFILKNSSHLVDHHHHLHANRQGYNPNYKEIKE
jgi:N-acetylmuramoyl-L-alanine amidase